MPCQALENGEATVSAAPRSGEKTVPATRRALWTTSASRKARVSSAMEVKTSSAMVRRERPPERRERATKTAGSVVRGGEQHALQGLELLQRLARADGHGVERVGRDHDRHAGLVVEAGLEAVEQRAAAGQGDALLHDVGGELRRGLVERDLHRVDDRRHRLLHRLADLLRGGDDRLREAGDEVAPADLCVQLLLEGPRRPERDLHLLRGAIADGEAVLLLDELHDRLVELIATDADGLAAHDAAERDDRDLGGATADVDDHVAGGLLHREARADGGGHG